MGVYKIIYLAGGIMKAMILAAGKGERLRPLTATMPKPLINIAGKPLIEHHLQALANFGIKDVVINTWYLGEQIIDTIGDGGNFNLNIKYSMEDELLDTGGGINNCLSFLDKDPFLVISADIFTTFDYTTLPMNPNALAHLVLVDNPPYHQKGDFCLNKGRVSLGDTDTFTYANIGIYRPEFFVNAPSGAFPLRDLLFKHILNNQVTGQYYNGEWHNIGTVDDLTKANSIA